jgi:hypothetical protein
MEVSYGEGLASHTGPESCGGTREGVFEALTRVRAGWVSSHENVYIRNADEVRLSEGKIRQIGIARSAWVPRGPRPHARTQAPHKEGSNLPYGSREISGLATTQVVARAVNPQGARRR